MKKRIMIIHPEGNINNNPNLTGIVEILTENDFFIDIYSPQRNDKYQFSPCNNVRLILQKPKCKSLILTTLSKYLTNYDLIIGVDQGIIEAAKIARIFKIPYGLISYEISFSDEIGGENKKNEIEACKDISFAVCQDVIRGGHLSKENKIPKGRLIYIPVAGRGVVRGEKRYDLYEKLGIAKDKKILLSMGSIGPWTQVEEVLGDIDNFPEEWVLVIHGRYGINEKFIHRHKDKPKVFFSRYPIENLKNIGPLLHSADMGLAMYKPTYPGPYTGDNLKYIGMSSGKISMCLQYGLPIIINDIKPMADFVEKYQLGHVIHNNNYFNCLNGGPLTDRNREKCYGFFEKYLDLNKNIRPLLHKINEL